SSLDFTCHSQKPAMSSFVSAKGPSITVCLPSENLTRAPFEVGCSPSAASITPAFTSSSLNFPISVRIFLSGITPASESLLAFTSGGLVAVAPTAVSAHFRLLEPTSWLIEDQRGDPQKSGPCGGTNTDYGKPSYAVGKATGGQKLHIKVQETIYHPGHYRVAL